MHSITRRLVIVVLLSELLLTSSVTIVSLAYEHTQRMDAFQVMLRGRADSVLAAVRDAEDEGDHVIFDPKTLDLPTSDVYEVREDSGTLLGRSPNWQGVSSAVLNQSRSMKRFSVQGADYRGIVEYGIRIVDAEKGGLQTQHHITVFYGSATRRVEEALQRATRFLIAANLALLLLSGLVAAILIQHGIAPLRKLVLAADSISIRSWTFDIPASASSTSELSSLSRALKTMLARLEASFRQQEHFLHDAAHELKTSVTIIKSSLQLLNYQERTGSEYRKGVDRSILDCERMEDLVQKMLMLAQLEQRAAAGPVRVDTPVNASNCIHQVVVQLAPLMQLRNVSFDLSVPDEIMTHVSEDDWATLSTNLLLNAIQHSPSGSTLRGALSKADGAVLFTMTDTGAGIPESQLPYVFDRFYRGDSSRARATGGTGLGLAICKAIVDAYAGSIHIESSPAAVTTVTVKIPL